MRIPILYQFHTLMPFVVADEVLATQQAMT